MLQVLSIDVYYLLDPGATFSFATPLIASMFDIFPNVLYEPFIIITPVGDSVVAKRVHRNCLIMLPIELLMLN